MSNHLSSGLETKDRFNAASTAKKPKKQHVPFSLRLSDKERSFLESEAGNKPLGRYIREKLLGDDQEQRRIFRKPKIDDQQLAKALAGLGQSRLASNLNQLAKHANMSTLEITDETERDPQEACQAVVEMRDGLFRAIGYTPKASRDARP